MYIVTTTHKLQQILGLTQTSHRAIAEHVIVFPIHGLAIILIDWFLFSCLKASQPASWKYSSYYFQYQWRRKLMKRDLKLRGITEQQGANLAFKIASLSEVMADSHIKFTPIGSSGFDAGTKVG